MSLRIFNPSCGIMLRIKLNCVSKRQIFYFICKSDAACSSMQFLWNKVLLFQLSFLR